MTPKRVFLDANVIVEFGNPPRGPLLGRLRDLVCAGFVTVLTTDLTRQEVAKRHTENDYRVVKELGGQHFRQIVENKLGAKVPHINKTQLRNRLAKVNAKPTEEMFEKLQCRTLEIDDIRPSVVFSAYGANEGFFGHQGKKDQFPDAFVFECLKAEATNEEPVTIVSKDGDFEEPIKLEKHLSLVKSLPEFFDLLGLVVEEPEVEDFLEKHFNELRQAVDDELGQWGLVGDVDESDIEETEVTDVEVIETTSFGSTEHGGPILIAGVLAVRATVQYTHPNWDNAMYDSEDKVLLPFESVTGKTEVGFEVDVSMSLAVGDDGYPERIDELSFRNDKFQYVELYESNYS